MNNMVYLLDQDRLDHYWPQIKVVLEEVPGFRELYSPEWAYEKAKTDHLQVWALSDGTIDGIIVTQISIYPRAKVLDILAAGGKGLLKYFDDVESVFDWLARDTGCDYIRALVRPGLVKKLKHRNITQIGVSLQRRVEQTRMQ